MDLYRAAATVLEKFENKQGSVKGLVFASEYKNVRQLYALVCESLKYQAILTTDIFKKIRALQGEKDLQGQGHLATVLLYEHLVGKGLGRAGQIRNCIVKHKSEIQKRCAELMDERGVSCLADLLSAQCQALNKCLIPRYARVNLLKTSTEEAVAAFSEEGWVWHGGLNLGSFQADVQALGEEGFGSDPMLPDLLVFPPGTDLHDHPWVKGGCLVLQDRASCFPAHVLNPAEGSVVLDCCAAPGNKTSHTASLMNNTGKIWAFERDGKRMALLQQQLRRNGVSVAKTLHQDFLAVDPHDQRFADIQYILVDPSCSGSGIIGRMEHVTSNPGTTDSRPNARLLSLQRFQISILKHALRFPRAQRVVYSTCSVHEEENEKVVAEVAEQVRDKFQLKTVFPQFPHRGIGSEGVAEKCIRTSPEKDLTNGFFVACFERISADVDDVKTGKRESVDEESESVESSSLKENSDTPSQKKNKKRKRGKESQSMPDLHHTINHLAEQDPERGETPKKKKKRCKSKKKSPENAAEGVTTMQNGFQETPNNVAEDSSGCDTLASNRSSKKRKENTKTCPDSVQVADLPDTSSDLLLTEKTSAKKKRKKKRKKPTEQEDSHPETQQRIEPLTQDPIQQRIEPSTQDSVSMEPPPKKKKKKKRKTERSEKEELSVENCEKSDTVLPEPVAKIGKKSGLISQDQKIARTENFVDQDATPKQKKKKKDSKKEREMTGKCEESILSPNQSSVSEDWAHSDSSLRKKKKKSKKGKM